MNENLSYSVQGLALTEAFEGCRLQSYRDIGGILTNGYGHVGPDVLPNQVITQATAVHNLLTDVVWAERAVRHYVKVVLTQAEFDGLVDICFNIGSGNFGKSTLVAKLNVGDKVGAEAEFQKWDKVAGKVSSGLARRRLAEAELFEHGIIPQVVA